MAINDADVAELVDARDLKSPAAPEKAQLICKTFTASPTKTDGTERDLQNRDAGSKHCTAAEFVVCLAVARQGWAGTSEP
jgi:hypothetical protein